MGFDMRTAVRHTGPSAQLWLRCLRSEAGSELIEMALVLPVLLVMIFGFINFTMIMFGIGNMTCGARAALRYACLHSSTSMAPATTASITSIINPYLFKYPSNTQSIAITYTNAGLNTIGSPVKIVVTVTYTITVPGYTYSGLKVASNTTGIIVQ